MSTICRRILVTLLLGACPLVAAAHPKAPTPRLEVIDGSGRAFESFALRDTDAGTRRAWLLATPGAAYRLRVRNPGGAPVGVVIAVDGRNIISGRRSALAAHEAMYVIAPYQTQILDGWRSDAGHVHGFYFTAAADSYAAAWGDYSALGTIALAAYRERSRPAAPSPEYRGETAPDVDSAGRARATPRAEAGTGYGERRWSPARLVSFEPDPASASRQVLRYAWRSTLCERHHVACADANRFWPQDGFAAPPPRRVPR